jgi:hypothetical protein
MGGSPSFDTRDLKEAKALLDEPAARRPYVLNLFRYSLVQVISTARQEIMS